MGQWSGGFEVAGVSADGYRLRRVSDGYPFPDLFPIEDVRPERRQHPLRGIDESYLDRGQPWANAASDDANTADPSGPGACGDDKETSSSTLS